MRDAFAVVDDLVGQGAADQAKRLPKGAQNTVTCLYAALPTGEQKHGVVGAHVAINTDGVEAALDRGPENGAQLRRRGVQVREQERWQASTPACPVAQLAFPALTSTAVTRPPVAAICRRPTSTGAASTWLLVNIAAALAPPPHTARATSGLPLALIPAVAEDH